MLLLLLLLLMLPLLCLMLLLLLVLVRRECFNVAHRMHRHGTWGWGIVR